MAQLSRRAALDNLFKNRTTASPDDELWDDLLQLAKQRNLIPIVADSVRTDRIFADVGSVLGDGTEKAVGEHISSYWAELIGYPYKEVSSLAHVAQYLFFTSESLDSAKDDYLLFVKKLLLGVGSGIDEAVADRAAELLEQLDEFSFSEIVEEIDYPVLDSPDEDCLRLLARLQLPIYITTSPYEFLERALKVEGRTTVRTQVCFWNHEPLTVDPAHRFDATFTPSAEEPVVYHLFGHEAYPHTLVISEDDHLEFLIAAAQPKENADHIIPLYLHRAVATSSLLMLGYRLRDWDFRTLFRGFIHSPQEKRRTMSMAIQLDPAQQQNIGNVEDARKYLVKYFGEANFRVMWDDTEQFISKLWQKYYQG